MKALFRSGADAHYEQGGEPCEVLRTWERTEGTLHRVRFADGSELWAEADELVLEPRTDAISIDPAQCALEGFEAIEALERE